MHPNILHLSFKSDSEHNTDQSLFVEEEFVIEKVTYDLVGVIYGGNSHFVFRFLKDGKLYEADGMAEHSKSTEHKKVRAALSKEIKGCHRASLSRIIHTKLIGERIKRTAQDAYYLKR